MKTLQGILIIVGIIVVFGVVGQNDYETSLLMSNRGGITSTPIEQTLKWAAAGAILVLAGVALTLRKGGD